MEGIIKFSCILKPAVPIDQKNIAELNRCRTELFDLGLIGATDEGIGFGNISVRLNKSEFIISASQTGQYRILEPGHFSIVQKCNFSQNKVQAAGAINPSSESLTHAAVYSSDIDIKAVIHVHNKKLWNFLLLPSFIKTPSEAQYGTPELAQAIKKLFKETEIINQKIFAMAGHEDGVIAFGKNLTETKKNLLKYLDEIK